MQHPVPPPPLGPRSPPLVVSVTADSRHCIFEISRFGTFEKKIIKLYDDTLLTVYVTVSFKYDLVAEIDQNVARELNGWLIDLDTMHGWITAGRPTLVHI